MAKDFKVRDAQKLALVGKTEQQMEKGLESIANTPASDNQQIAKQPTEEKGEILGSPYGEGDLLTSRKVVAEPTKGVQVPMPESVYMRMMMYKLRHNVSLKDMVVEATRYWLDAMEKKDKRQKK